MVTSSTNVNVFDSKLYQELSAVAAKYHREAQAMDVIPVAKVGFNKDEYKKPIYGLSQGVHGGTPSADSDQMETVKGHNVYSLKDVYATLYYDQYDMMKEGPYLLTQRNEQLTEWARNANISVMKGVYKNGFNAGGIGQGAKLSDGIVDNATSVVDLDGTDSTLAASGDVYKALVKIVTSIPYRYVEGKEIILGMTPHFYDMANSALFTNDSGVTEWKQFFDLHVAGSSPYKVSPKIVYSNDLFIDTADTVLTHDRLFAFIGNDPSIVERAYSRGFGMMGEATNHIGGVTQTWTTKLAGCVHDANGVMYSEQIAWVNA